MTPPHNAGSNGAPIAELDGSLKGFEGAFRTRYNLLDRHSVTHRLCPTYFCFFAHLCRLAPWFLPGLVPPPPSIDSGRCQSLCHLLPLQVAVPLKGTPGSSIQPVFATFWEREQRDLPRLRTPWLNSGLDQGSSIRARRADGPRPPHSIHSLDNFFPWRLTDGTLKRFYPLLDGTFHGFLRLPGSDPHVTLRFRHTSASFSWSRSLWPPMLMTSVRSSRCPV